MERRRRRLEEEVTIPSKDKFESQKTDFECVNSARKIREICSRNYQKKSSGFPSVYVYVFISVSI